MEKKEGTDGFLALPLEVIAMIFAFLPSRRDVTRAGICCRHLFSVLDLLFPAPTRKTEPLTTFLSFNDGTRNLLTKGDQSCNWKGKWVCENYTSNFTDSFTDWYGEFGVTDIQLNLEDETRPKKIISLLMVPQSCITTSLLMIFGTKTNHAFDNEIAYEKHYITRKSSLFHKTPWTVQLIFTLLPSASSLEPIYGLTEARLIGPPEISSGTYLPNLSAESNSKLQEVELRVAASIDRYFEEESYYGHEQESDWRNRERVFAEKRDIERHLAPKYSYEELKALVASKAEIIKVAQGMGAIIAHLKEEDFPVAFNGLSRAAFLALKIWEKDKLVKKAGLF